MSHHRNNGFTILSTVLLKYTLIDIQACVYLIIKLLNRLKTAICVLL